MQTRRLIQSIVKATGKLVARVATAGGTRTSIADLGDIFMASMISELQARGVRQRVMADMFGLHLRSLQYQMRRLSESVTDPGRLLWEAVFDHVRIQGECTRTEILYRFRRDEEATVRGVLSDLVETGLVSSKGKGRNAIFRFSALECVNDSSSELAARAKRALVAIKLFRDGPMSADDLCSAMGMTSDEIASLIDGMDNVRVEEQKEGLSYDVTDFVLPVGATEGAEAAVFHHFESVTDTIAERLAPRLADPTTRTGASTYSFDVWEGHPEEEAVCALLSETRDGVAQIMARVRAADIAQTKPPRAKQITFYAGLVEGQPEPAHDF